MNKTNTYNPYKVAKAIRQLEQCEIYHECYDVEEEGVEHLLYQYGINYQWTESEKEVMKQELIQLAAREEIREAARWAAQETDPLLLSIPNRPAPGYKLIQFFNKTLHADMKRKQKHIITTCDPFKAESTIRIKPEVI